MTLLLRPSGRGSWRVITMQITGDRACPLLVKVGDKIVISGITWRVVEVQA